MKAVGRLENVTSLLESGSALAGKRGKIERERGREREAKKRQREKKIEKERDCVFLRETERDK